MYRSRHKEERVFNTRTLPDCERLQPECDCLALFAELASDEVAQGGAVVPPVETPFLVAAVHSNSGRWSAVEDTVLQIARDLYIMMLQIDSHFYINLY